MEAIAKVTQSKEKKSGFHTNLAKDCLRILNKYLLFPSIPGNLLCAGLLFIGLYKSSNQVVYWFSVMCTVLVIRVVFYSIYLLKPQLEDLNYYLFLLGSCLVALTWGYAGSFLMPNNDIIHQSIIIIIIAGITSGALQSLQASRLMSTLYILLAIVPLTIWLYSQKSFAYTILGISMSAYCIFMLTACQRGYKHLREALELRYKNTDLIASLSQTSKQLTDTNNNLIAQIKERKRIQNEFRELATHDSLTGLSNRAFMSQFLNKTIKRAKRYHIKLAIFFIDLDDFKQINDNFGHDIGDKVLIDVSNILKKNTRESDVVARLGGDEFIVVMETTNSNEAVLHKAEVLNKELKRKIEIDNHSIDLTSSIGISIYPDNGDREQLLLKNADIALYQAKQQGKNRVVLYQNNSGPKPLSNSRPSML